MRRFALLAVALLLFAALPAAAQQPPPALVGRISFVSGHLAFHMNGETQWSAAAVNYPVATGGSFWSDPQSRAEIRIGPQTLFLSNDTEVDVTQLDGQVMQLSVPQGRVGLHLRSLDQGSTVEIDTPRGAVSLLQPGSYDIDAGNQDRPTRVAVFAGNARFVGGSTDVPVNAGDVAVISGGDPLSVASERAAPDAFVTWYRSRDYQAPRVAAPRYVSPAMTGYEELDQYGSWQMASDYGRVWYPRSVPAGWAPYRHGHWISVAPWGWTWVDDAPWGFAPFHYGRWARVGGRWGWIPGTMVQRPVYAPALVAFIGDPRSGVALPGVAGPTVGWFPLGPDEVYWPAYAHDPAYIRQINVTNVSETRIVNITNVAAGQPAGVAPPQVANQTFANRAAATVVPVNTVVSAAPVAAAVVAVSAATLQHAAVSAQPPRAVPPPRPAPAATSAPPPPPHPTPVPAATAPHPAPPPAPAAPHPAPPPAAAAPHPAPPPAAAAPHPAPPPPAAAAPHLAPPPAAAAPHPAPPPPAAAAPHLAPPPAAAAPHPAPPPAAAAPHPAPPPPAAAAPHLAPPPAAAAPHPAPPPPAAAAPHPAPPPAAAAPHPAPPHPAPPPAAAAPHPAPPPAAAAPRPAPPPAAAAPHPAPPPPHPAPPPAAAAPHPAPPPAAAAPHPAPPHGGPPEKKDENKP